jgi:APA family basic amino acid/polyamine antiporter
MEAVLPIHAAAPTVLRGIRRWDLVAVGINGMIGAGILGLPSKTYALAQDYSLLAVVACALVLGLVVACLAEVSSRFEESGAAYLFALKAYGPFIGFVVGWLAWLAKVLAFAYVSNLLVVYLSRLFPLMASGAPRVAAIAGLLVGFACLLIIGIRQTTWMSNILTSCKIAILLSLIAIALAYADWDKQWETTALKDVPTASGLGRAMLLYATAFTGFVNPAVGAGEATNPRRNVAFAAAASFAIVTALYVGTQWACISLVPNLAHSEQPIADAIGGVFGENAARVVAGAAVVMLLGTLLAIAFTMSRTLFALAEQRQLPRALRTHPSDVSNPLRRDSGIRGRRLRNNLAN